MVDILMWTYGFPAEEYAYGSLDLLAITHQSRAGRATAATPAMAGAISGTKPYPLHRNLTTVCPLQTKRNSIKNKRNNILKVKRYCILIYSSEEIIVLTLVGSYSNGTVSCGLYYVSSICFAYIYSIKSKCAK